jgi:prephenate dehydrogenase
VRWQKVTLVGVGLLGGSLGLALRQRRLAERVEGYVRRPASVTECARLGLVDRATLDLAEAVRGADLVVLCTPLAQMRPLVEEMRPVLRLGSVVTDVGSAKSGLVEELEPLIAGAGAHYVGSHPMAGAERMGAGAARADLFDNAVCIVTPTARSDAGAVERLLQFWHALGMRPLTLAPELHDELVARCSHLPHLIAATLARFVLDPAHPKEQHLLCASGFRDTTRVASGSPEMWRDVALANRRQLSQALSLYVERLRSLQGAIDSGDAAAIEDFLREAKTQRDHWHAQSFALSPE